MSDRFWSAILINRLLTVIGSEITVRANLSVALSTLLEYQRLGMFMKNTLMIQKHKPRIGILLTSDMVDGYKKRVANGVNNTCVIKNKNKVDTLPRRSLFWRS